MMKKNVIVSLADSNYFCLLEELINSIKASLGKDLSPLILESHSSFLKSVLLFFLSFLENYHL